MRTTGRWLLLGVALATSCGGTNPDLKAARSSGYKADFAIVFNAVVKVVRERFKHYPDRVEENAAAGTIETAWIQVRTTTQGAEDHTTTQQQRDTMAAQERAEGNAPVFRTSGTERVIYLVRYQLYVVGGDPFRVIVRGKAAKFTEGDRLHVELKGADKPSWLDGRVEAMEIDIYRRLKKFAVPLKVESTTDDRPPPMPSELARYGKIPRPAAERIEEVRRAAADRDFPRLRAQMADDFEWSMGADSSADQAIATWQADGGNLGAMIEVLEKGCRAESETRVTCPPEFSEQVGFLGYRAAFERRGDRWLMTSFLSGD